LRKFNGFRLSSGRPEDYSIEFLNLMVAANIDGNINTMTIFSKYPDERPNRR